MESFPKLSRNQDTDRATAIAFFKGCSHTKCLSKDCLNFIGQRAFASLRIDPEQNIHTVLQMIGKNALTLNCILKQRDVHQLPEFCWQFTQLFSLDLNDSRIFSEIFMRLI